MQCIRCDKTNGLVVERLDIIDFCDAAGEWGSTVPIPAREAERMIELADQRRIADLGDHGPVRGDRHGYEVCWREESYDEADSESGTTWMRLHRPECDSLKRVLHV
jgi:hypothetical protein